MKGFLYGQTEYNLLNNSIHLNDYISMAKNNEFTFLSITDKNLYGSYKFYMECKKNNIKPIIGLELRYKDDDNYESVVLAYAKNNVGYKNLLKLSTYKNTNELTNTLSILNEYKDGLAYVFVLDESIIERYFISKAYKELDNKIEEIKINSDIYLGYSFTNKFGKKEYYSHIIDYVKQREIKCLPLHNCRYLLTKDYIIYESLRKIDGITINIKDDEDYSFSTKPFINKEVIDFVNSINLDLFNQHTYLPKYPNTKGLDSSTYLAGLCNKGLQKRLNNKVNKVYQDRLNYELSVIHKMGYDDYFLIVWDFILYAKKNKILVGPGRGSAAGSLVAYCLGITDVDPLQYGLLFERFLNPERISMPDIDTDFPDNKRDEVIRYVNELYGNKKVCYISAFNTFQYKSAIRDLGKIMKFDSTRIEELTKLIEKNDYDTLLEQFKDRTDIYNFLYIIKGIEGLPRHISTHAAGIIISSFELDDVIPLQSGLDGLYQSELEASDLEQIGLLKMDFLGIRNLSIVDEVLKEVNRDINDLRNISFEDKKVYELLQKGDTLGVFQLESSGIRKVLMNLKPTCFNDLVAVLALYRPGPMDNIDEFIARKHGKKFEYLHPILEPILKETYGIIVYQEQIMQIARAFAGFSLGEADLLRRAVSKKNEAKLMELKNDFITRSINKGFSKDVAVNIYDYILKFANYGFNKSHSVAYGVLAYQMAYLKVHCFKVFISKILNNVIGSKETMIDYIDYAKERNVVTYKPNVNVSKDIFVVNKVGMFMPLQAIHSIGINTTLEIIKERETNGLYKDYTDFKNRTKLGSSVMEALIYSGALDCFGISKRKMIEQKDTVTDIISKYLVDVIEDESEYDFNHLQEKELEYLGFNMTYNLFNNVDKYYVKYKASPLNGNKNRAVIVFDRIKEITTKRNEQMFVGSIKDQTTKADFVIFPSALKDVKCKLEYGKLYLIEFKLNVEEGKNKYIINRIGAIE